MINEDILVTRILVLQVVLAVMEQTAAAFFVPIGILDGEDDYIIAAATIVEAGFPDTSS